jgi:hypothetical protein
VIVASLLLVAGAVALLAVGLLNGSNACLVGSIAASLLAAIALVVGSRQAGAGRTPAGQEPAEPAEPHESAESQEPAAPREPAVPAARQADGDPAEDPGAAGRDDYRRGEREPMTEAIPAARRAPVVVREPLIPAQGGSPDAGHPHSGRLTAVDPVDVDDEEPPDEPVAQQVPAGDAARVASMSNEVLVVDGRPRYHLPGCVHLLSRASEPLPVSEAVELGFSPCGLCEPDSALLSEARQV